jgi:hypothetical protein
MRFMYSLHGIGQWSSDWDEIDGREARREASITRMGERVGFAILDCAESIPWFWSGES